MTMTASLQAPLRLALLIGIFAAGAYAQARGLLPGVLKHWGDIVYLSRQHLGLVAMSGAALTIIGWRKCSSWALCLSRISCSTRPSLSIRAQASRSCGSAAPTRHSRSVNPRRSALWNNE